MSENKRNAVQRKIYMDSLFSKIKEISVYTFFTNSIYTAIIQKKASVDILERLACRLDDNKEEYFIHLQIPKPPKMELGPHDFPDHVAWREAAIEHYNQYLEKEVSPQLEILKRLEVELPEKPSAVLTVKCSLNALLRALLFPGLVRRAYTEKLPQDCACK